jgi:Protein of unknown function (DUF1036)
MFSVPRPIGLLSVMKSHSIVGSALIALLFLELPAYAASPNCRIVMTQDKDSPQKNFLDHMRGMSRHFAVGGAAAAVAEVIVFKGGGRYVRLAGPALSLLSAVFAEADTIAEAKQQPLQLCERGDKTWVMGPPEVTEQIAKDGAVYPPTFRQAAPRASDRGKSEIAVTPPASQSSFNVHGAPGLRFTEKRINTLLSRCHNCSQEDILLLPPQNNSGSGAISQSKTSKQIRICNKSSRTISAAIGYIEGVKRIASGWLVVNPGECNFTGAFLQDTIYAYATTDTPALSPGGLHWRPERELASASLTLMEKLLLWPDFCIDWRGLHFKMPYSFCEGSHHSDFRSERFGILFSGDILARAVSVIGETYTWTLGN